MICPACANPMIVVEHRRIELDYCPQCHGVWFDAGELELLLKPAGQTDESQRHESLETREAKSAEKKRKCPICHQKMRKANTGREPVILIDACQRGHGLWFDGGELNQLAQELKGKAGEEHPVVDFLSGVFTAPEKTGKA